ncbi:ubiquinone biosynthesis monooxygenase Coq7 [Mycoemilia scoparia]|uniref:5-demethoxyubiquinone hydroxylase, mitochondrial n=1 Tax=Mycoemilia scoparia TaxID=417184 RepID=A0A9W7ZYB2_9FUNG|nr:ubiquinone biosynthesis monooxygenase Coq7 [Mycoemilia scoparia]
MIRRVVPYRAYQRSLRQAVIIKNYSTDNANINKEKEKHREFTEAEHSLIDRVIRVDHAGETAAVWIYAGQMAVLGKDKRLRELLTAKQEDHHLATFDKKVVDFRVRPTILKPVAAVGGFALGAITALMGEKSAMTCTEAVETAIGTHYDNQLRDLVKIDHPEMKELLETIALFRDQELEHLDTAVENGSRSAPFYRALSAFIGQGCKTAIWLCERV